MAKQREIPLLACGQMVKALLTDLKRMTRRTNGLKEINENPDYWHRVEQVPDHHAICDHGVWRLTGGDPCYPDRWSESYMKCPYRVGDIIWWRETWAAPIGWDFRKPREIPEGTPIRYLADGPKRVGCGKTRPAIFMPKWACRLRSEIVEVLPPQRVQGITEEDVEYEGLLPRIAEDGEDSYYEVGSIVCDSSIEAFQHIWSSLHGPESWVENFWVWPVRFRNMMARMEGD